MEEGFANQALCEQYILMKRGFSSNFKAWFPLIRGLSSMRPLGLMNL